jgi:hypothetical protein
VFPATQTFTIPANADFDAVFHAGGTVNLPPAVAAGRGRTFAIRALGGTRVNASSAAPNDTVEGTKTISLGIGAAEVFVSDGNSQWLSVADRQARQLG